VVLRYIIFSLVVDNTLLALRCSQQITDQSALNAQKIDQKMQDANILRFGNILNERHRKISLKEILKISFSK
jgi:hypothetical protein